MSTLNLNATYTLTYPGDTEPTTITPKVRTKTRPDGVTLTIIKGLAPLLADHIDAIADEGDRLHALTVLGGATIFIRDTPDDEMDDGEHGGSHYRDRGTLATTYYGARGLPVDVVLDLAEQLRTQLENAEALTLADQTEAALETTVANGREAAERYADPQRIAQILTEGPKTTNRTRVRNLGMLLNPLVTEVKFAKGSDGATPEDLKCANAAVGGAEQAATDAKFIRRCVEKGFEYPEDKRNYERCLQDCKNWLRQVQPWLDGYAAASRGDATGKTEDRWVWLIADFSPFPGAPDATVTDDPEVGSTRDAARTAALHVLSTAPSAADPNSPASATIRAWQEDPSLNHVWIHRTVAMAVFPYGGEHGSLEAAAQSIVRKLGEEYAPRYAEDALVVEGQPLTPTQERWRRFIEANDAQQ